MPSLSIKIELAEVKSFGKRTKKYRASLGGFEVEGSREEIGRKALEALAASRPQVCLVRVGEGLRLHVSSFDGVETLRPADSAPQNGLIPLQHIGHSAPDTMAREVSSSLLGFAQDEWRPGCDAPPEYLGAADCEAFAAWVRAANGRRSRESA